MKKNRLFSQVGGALLALVLVLSMCVSPLASQVSEAADEGLVIAASVESSAENPVVFDEGETFDIESYFTMHYNGSVPSSVLAYYDDINYAEDVTEVAYYSYQRDVDGNIDYEKDLVEGTEDTHDVVYAPMKDIFTFKYEIYDAGNANWKVAGESDDLSVAGDYRVTASLSTQYYLATDPSDASGWSDYYYSTQIADNTIYYSIGELEVELGVSEDAPSSLYEISQGESEDAYDMSSYFGAIVVNKKSGEGKDATIAEEALTVAYYKADANGDATGNALEDVPTVAGSYVAVATLSGTVTCGDDTFNDVESFAKHSYEIVAAELVIAQVKEIPTFTEGDAIDLSTYFTLLYKDQTPDIWNMTARNSDLQYNYGTSSWYTTINGEEITLTYDRYDYDTGNYIYAGTDSEGNKVEVPYYSTWTNYSDARYQSGEEGYLPFAEAFTMTYYDKDGNVLKSAPSTAGTYYVTAEIPEPGDYDVYSVFLSYPSDADPYAPMIYDYLYSGTISAKVPFEIKAAPAQPSSENPGNADAAKDSQKTNVENASGSAAKTGDAASIALYVVLIAACGIVVAVMAKKRRTNA